LAAWQIIFGASAAGALNPGQSACSTLPNNSRGRVRANSSLATDEIFLVLEETSEGDRHATVHVQY